LPVFLTLGETQPAPVPSCIVLYWLTLASAIFRFHFAKLGDAALGDRLAVGT
jgi:hypothetical protein